MTRLRLDVVSASWPCDRQALGLDACVPAYPINLLHRRFPPAPCFALSTGEVAWATSGQGSRIHGGAS